MTGLTEVTLRKVYKELLENWDDLLPSNYNPVVPPEKAFPTATISSSGRTRGGDPVEDRDKNGGETKAVMDMITGQSKGKENAAAESKDNFQRAFNPLLKATQSMEVDGKEKTADAAATSSLRPLQFTSPPALAAGVVPWPFRPPMTTSSHQFMQLTKGASYVVEKEEPIQPNLNDKFC